MSRDITALLAESEGLADLRDRVVDAVGVSGAHALEDGFVVGLVVGLALTYLPLAGVLAAAVTGLPSRAGPLAILSELGDIVRAEDARAQESYFAGALIVGVLVGLGVGAAAATAAAWSGVSIPSV